MKKSNLRYKDEHQGDSSKRNNPSVEQGNSRIIITPQYKGDKDNHNQHYTGNVYESCDGFRVIENLYLDFTGLKCQYDAN